MAVAPDVPSSSLPETPAARRARAFWQGLKELTRNPFGAVGLVIVVLFFLSALFAPYLTPYDPYALDVPSRLARPSFEHLLGTDQLGRDTFTRVLYGGRIAMQLALVAVTAALVIGLVLGMIAGYGPRWLDSILILVFDTLRSFPTIIMGLAIVAVTQPSLTVIMVIFVLHAAPAFGRIARTQTMALKNTEFILAEKSLGARTPLVLTRHMMPNVLGPLLILAAMDVPVVVTVEAGLSFLGLGIQPPTASWGGILKEGYSVLRETPWLVIAGGMPLVLTTLGFTFLGEALRDSFDPKLREAR
ncbi:ABC transporter permease [Chelativorans xinjiangense]|uniref:ABC transporter permease n=1 Tax=Chelativorans xinjiangense TaxID=2681485 RepID=UPI00135C01B8|nr:ABC transporter permease [Chelativorans xinjiangense]